MRLNEKLYIAEKDKDYWHDRWHKTKLELQSLNLKIKQKIKKLETKNQKNIDTLRKIHFDVVMSLNETITKQLEMINHINEVYKK